MTELLEPRESALADALAALGRVNPFLPERRLWERRALGDAFVPCAPVWSLGEEGGDVPNVARIALVAEDLADTMRRRLERRPASPADRERYVGVVFLVLYNRYSEAIAGRCGPAGGGTGTASIPEYARYVEDFRSFFRVCGPPDPEVDTPAHLFACFWQIRRAFEQVFGSMVGGSMPAAELRAATWQSIFSHDAHRYRRFLFRVMPDVPTLITGPTGTGKELVARAIGLSAYIPFDEQRRAFAHAPTFLPLNLSAMPATLIESELFGHRKGAFTGAVADREGWLAACPRGGVVFLDEIGDLDPMLQVKLLRVLEDRTFSAIGDTRPQRFEGKILAATHRDLPTAIASGGFRSDLYFRLIGDRIVTPTLRERLDADPAELRRVLRALVGRSVPEGVVGAVTAEVLAEIERARGAAWPWPGNVRELAQCARQALVQGTCGPPEDLGGRPVGPFAALDDGELPMIEVQRRYARHVFERTGTWKAASEVLQLDWRTVRSLVDGP